MRDKKPVLPKNKYILACKLSIQSACADAFNKILQEGLEIKELSFVPETLRDIADQMEKLIAEGSEE